MKTIYVSYDGKQFNEQFKCEQYESNLPVMKELKSFVDAKCPQPDNVEEITRFVYENYETISEIILKVR